MRSPRDHRVSPVTIRAEDTETGPVKRERARWHTFHQSRSEQRILKRRIRMLPAGSVTLVSPVTIRAEDTETRCDLYQRRDSRYVSPVTIRAEDTETAVGYRRDRLQVYVSPVTIRAEDTETCLDITEDAATGNVFHQSRSEQRILKRS